LSIVIKKKFYTDVHVFKLQALRLHVDSLQASIGTLEQKVKKFGNERYAGSPDLLNFYTGFTSYEMSKAVFKVVEPTSANFIRWTRIQRQLFQIKLSGSNPLV